MANIIVGIFLLAALVIAGRHIYKLFHGEPVCCSTDTPQVPEKKLSGPIIGKKVIDIKGMTCRNCKNRVEMMLDDIDGASATVNLHRSHAVLKMTRDVSDDEIRSALAGSGYEITGIKPQ